MPSAVRPTTARRWPSPRRAACDRSWPTGHLGLGNLSLRTDKREQAREHLTTATAMYREMDMRFWLEQAAVDMTYLKEKPQ